MSYSTILVHLDDSPRCARRVAVACQLALEHDAHLIGLAPTGTLQVPMQARVALGEAWLQERAADLHTDAGRTASAFEEAVRVAGLRSFEPRVSSMRTEDALELNARYADLVVVGRPDASDPACTLDHDGLSMLVQRIGRPILAVPSSAGADGVGRRPLVAWSATREARRAVDDALPILRKADRVDVLVFNARSGQSEGHGELPGADLALLLARQGVEVEARNEVTAIDVGSALLSRAADLGSDLIVMGAYGHAYLREWLFGGVTDTMLRSSPLPVLMSH